MERRRSCRWTAPSAVAVAAAVAAAAAAVSLAPTWAAASPTAVWSAGSTPDVHVSTAAVEPSTSVLKGGRGSGSGGRSDGDGDALQRPLWTATNRHTTVGGRRDGGTPRLTPMPPAAVDGGMAPVDRQTFVSILAALSAANTRLTRPDAYGESDGAGGRGAMRNRTDPAGVARRPAAVVVLHGLGSSGAHAVEGLAEDLLADTLAYTTLVGPSSGPDAAGNPRSWFPIGSVSLGRVPASDVAGGAAGDLAAVAQRLNGVVAAVVAGGVPRNRVVVAGFSQGAAMAVDYVLAGHASGLGGVIVWGGWMPRPSLGSGAAAADAAAGLRVAVLHGRLDWLVPPAAATASAAAMRRVGADVAVSRYWADHFLGSHGPSETAIAAFVRAVVPP